MFDDAYILHLYFASDKEFGRSTNRVLNLSGLTTDYKISAPTRDLIVRIGSQTCDLAQLETIDESAQSRLIAKTIEAIQKRRIALPKDSVTDIRTFVEDIKNTWNEKGLEVHLSEPGRKAWRDGQLAAVRAIDIGLALNRLVSEKFKSASRKYISWVYKITCCILFTNVHF